MAVRNPDGSITNPDGSVTYPANSKVGGADQQPEPASDCGSHDGGRAPRRLRRRVAPAPVVPRTVVPVGTSFDVRINQSLAASRNEVGDRWTGELRSPVVVSGNTVFPGGHSGGGVK